MSSGAPLPRIILLCGFLGSGKTTLLLDWLARNGGAGTGIIVNDVGEIDIDGATIASTTEDIQMIRLANGCVCCSLGSSLPVTIASLLDRHEQVSGTPLDRIVIETSGLSRPAPIVRQLQGLPVPFSVSVVSTYDSVNGPLSSRHFEEAAAQLSAAQIIVQTKTDLVAEADVAEASRTIGLLNPFARIVERRMAVSDGDVFDGVEQHARVELMPSLSCDASLDHGRVGVFLVELADQVERDDVLEWFDNLAGYGGPRLLRAKGIVTARDAAHPLLVQSVGTVFDHPRPIPGYVGPSAVIVIARDMKAGELDLIKPPIAQVRRGYSVATG